MQTFNGIPVSYLINSPLFPSQPLSPTRISTTTTVYHLRHCWPTVTTTIFWTPSTTPTTTTIFAFASIIVESRRLSSSTWLIHTRPVVVLISRCSVIASCPPLSSLFSPCSMLIVLLDVGFEIGEVSFLISFSFVIPEFFFLF